MRAMTKTEAIELAARFARKRGYDPALYDGRAAKKVSQWQIACLRSSGKSKPRPGDFFTVYVNGASKSVERLVPGK
jgi:hypothetical protein